MLPNLPENVEDQLQRLLKRVNELEQKNAEREILCRQLLPAVQFLAIFLALASAGFLVANLSIPASYAHVSGMLQGAIFASLMSSLTLSMLAQVIRSLSGQTRAAVNTDLRAATGRQI